MIIFNLATPNIEHNDYFLSGTYYDTYQNSRHNTIGVQHGKKVGVSLTNIILYYYYIILTSVVWTATV